MLRGGASRHTFTEDYLKNKPNTVFRLKKITITRSDFSWRSFSNQRKSKRVRKKKKETKRLRREKK